MNRIIFTSNPLYSPRLEAFLPKVSPSNFQLKVSNLRVFFASQVKRRHGGSCGGVAGGRCYGELNKQAVSLVPQSRRTQLRVSGVAASTPAAPEHPPPAVFELRVNLLQSIREALRGRRCQMTSSADSALNHI